ncbi:MAG TPA: hypothetical protein VJP76_01510 [Candidatus Tumulicola sp.]|nr:hypothetical protein [Candidatus Tumulicola sp.]
MFVAVVLAALAAAPAPTASPLKEIIRVTGRPLCTALKDRIGPSVAALLENDVAAGDGTRRIYEMGRDAGRPWMQIDKLHLENDISQIVRNLDTVDHLLRTQDAQAAANEGADHDVIAELSAKLRSVADAQRAELNTLDGTLESEEMAELMNSDLPLALTTSGFGLSRLGGDEITSDAAAYGAATPGPEATDASSGAAPAPQPLEHPSGRAPSPQSSPGAPGNTYTVLGNLAVSSEQSELTLEKAFARSLLPAAAQCRRLTSPSKP